MIHNAEAVSAAMVDMKTGERGFLIAGKDGYLEPFNHGAEIFDELIAKGKQLTSDNLTQVKRWQEVHRIESQWLAETAEPQIAIGRQVTQGAHAIASFKTILSRLTGKNILIVFVSY